MQEDASVTFSADSKDANQKYHIGLAAVLFIVLVSVVLIGQQLARGAPDVGLLIAYLVVVTLVVGWLSLLTCHWHLMTEPTPVIRVGPDGLYDRRWGPHTIPWSAIKSVRKREDLPWRWRAWIAAAVASVGVFVLIASSDGVAGLGAIGVAALILGLNTHVLVFEIDNWHHYYRPSPVFRLTLLRFPGRPAHSLWASGLSVSADDILKAIRRFHPQLPEQ